jgi:hypothetical protein
MKNALIIMALCILLVPSVVYSQQSGTRPRAQYMTILPANVAAKIGCCVAPYNKVWVDRETRVVWENGDNGSVSLKFGSGDNCKEIAGTTKTTIEIVSGCSVVKEIPKGAMVTTKFSDPGAYPYTLEFIGKRDETPSGMRKPETGEINVF